MDRATTPRPSPAGALRLLLWPILAASILLGLYVLAISAASLIALAGLALQYLTP